MKRIRLTIEYGGACGERAWAKVLADAIEELDISQTSRVVKRECLTDLGTTEPAKLTPKQESIRKVRIQASRASKDVLMDAGLL